MEPAGPPSRIIGSKKADDKDGRVGLTVVRAGESADRSAPRCGAAHPRALRQRPQPTARCRKPPSEGQGQQ